MDTVTCLQTLLASPHTQASTWVRLQGRIDVLASIDGCGPLLRLVLPVGRPRCSHDLQLASDLLRWNGEHLDAGSPCFSLDERDGAICLGAALSLPGLSSETAAAALEHLATTADEARVWLADAILFFD